jgi:L-cystine uptake protein TcyP (sodium:dicarboxylate symporter family)
VVLKSGNDLVRNQKEYSERIANVTNVITGFNDGVLDLSNHVVGMMTAAISKSKTSTYKLKKLIELALFLLVLQIPIMFMSICFHRSKACHGMSNIVWVKNVLVCIGFGWATYYQGIIY